MSGKATNRPLTTRRAVQVFFFLAASELMKLRILSPGLLKDGDVRVGVLPEREKILIRRLGLGGVALHSVSPRETKMGESADWLVHHDSAMVEDFLKLRRPSLPLCASR